VKDFSFQNNEQLAVDIVDNLATESRGNQATLTAQLVARVPLEYPDFHLARDEAWWWGVRTGRLAPDLDSHAMRIIPGKDTGEGMLNGYYVELTFGDTSYRRRFTNKSMSSVANRKILELAKDEQSEAKIGDQFSYYLTTIPADEDQPGNVPMRAQSCREPLVLQDASLKEHLAASEYLTGVSEPPHEPDDAPMPIFVTQDVWDESKEQAHRGGEQESAALFSGRLFRDTDSPEVFLRLDACLEAAHAHEEKLAVTFTGETWAHARNLLEVRRKRLRRPHEIIVGSVHRHPFPPAADSSGNRKCEACSIAKYCSRSTAVPSTDDFEWHRSVFSGQPYTTLLIWGYNARDEEDFRVYGLENATFQERTIRLLKHEP